MRRLLSLVLLLSTPAMAADLSQCDELYAFRDTARFDLAMQARESTSQLFGAAGFAEDVLFPAMEAQRQDAEYMDSSGAAGMRVLSMYGGLSSPGLEQAWGCPYSSSLRDYDMYASAFGAGGGIGPFSAFVSTGATAMISWNQTYLRNAGALSMPMVMGLIAMSAPVWMLVDDNVIWQNDPQGIFADFIAGAQFDGGPVGFARIGYSGTEGPYANYSHPKTKFTVAAAFSRDFRRVPYGLAGVRGLELPGNGAAGKTSLYGRQLGYQPQGDALDPTQQLSLNARSVHLEQIDLFKGHVDLYAAMYVAPELGLNEARIGVGTKQVDESTGESGYARLTAGVYDQPDYWFWAVEGGIRPSVTANMGADFGNTKLEGVIGWNEPSLLRIYPYAVDNFSFQFKFMMGGGAL